jgi:alpha-L-rhamnosidase
VVEGVNWCNISKQTPYGEIAIRWQKQQGEFTMEVIIPVGVEAEVVIPAEAKSIKHNKQSLNRAETVVVKSGKHVIKYNI